jgi:hypothetical protein
VCVCVFVCICVCLTSNLPRVQAYVLWRCAQSGCGVYSPYNAVGIFPGVWNWQSYPCSVDQKNRKSLVYTPLFRFSDLMFLRFPLSEVGSVENSLLSFKSFQHSHECWFSHGGKHWDCRVMKCDAAWMRRHVSADGGPKSNKIGLVLHLLSAHCKCRGYIVTPDRTQWHTHTHSVGLSGWGIGPSQRPVLCNTQHSQETDIHAPREITILRLPSFQFLM